MENRFKEQLRDGLEVWSEDGKKLGKIVDVRADNFVVEKGYFFPKDFVLPFDDVREIQADRVLLARTQEQLGVRGGFWDAFAGIAGPEDRTKQKEPTNVQQVQQRSEEEIRVPLHEEELRTSKHTEQVGEVQVSKHVVTEQRQVTVPVAREVVTVERMPVTGTTQAGAGEGAFQETSVTMPIREEMVDVEKRPVVHEEIRVSKTSEQEEQPVSTTVRREVADVERAGETTEERPVRKTG